MSHLLRDISHVFTLQKLTNFQYFGPNCTAIFKLFTCCRDTIISFKTVVVAQALEKRHSVRVGILGCQSILPGHSAFSDNEKKMDHTSYSSSLLFPIISYSCKIYLSMNQERGNVEP